MEGPGGGKTTGLERNWSGVSSRGCLVSGAKMRAAASASAEALLLVEVIDGFRSRGLAARRGQQKCRDQGSSDGVFDSSRLLSLEERRRVAKQIKFYSKWSEGSRCENQDANKRMQE